MFRALQASTQSLAMPGSGFAMVSRTFAETNHEQHPQPLLQRAGSVRDFGGRSSLHGGREQTVRNL